MPDDLQTAPQDRTAAPARTVAVVVNPSSGTMKARPELMDDIRAAFAGRGRIVEIGDDGPVRAAERAADDGATCLVAAGGDGTIAAVAGVAVDRGLELGVIAGGTFNYFARGYDIPEDPHDVARLILTGTARPVDVGVAGDRVFLNNLSLGIYPVILKEREEVYGRFGRSRVAAYWSVVKVFARFQRPKRLTLEMEGETERLKTPLLFVARSAFQLQTFELDGADCVAGGNLAIFAAPSGGRWQMFRSAWRLVRKVMTPGLDFRLYCTDDVTIGGPASALVACDGEKYRSPLPLRVFVRRGALKLIAP